MKNVADLSIGFIHVHVYAMIIYYSESLVD